MYVSVLCVQVWCFLLLAEAFLLPDFIIELWLAVPSCSWHYTCYPWDVEAWTPGTQSQVGQGSGIP